MSAPEVRVYWRPGCPYCARLRADLRRIGLPTTELNIWADPAAAAAVRAVAGGNETVPTVLVGDDAALVNPTAARVLDAVRTRAPGLLAGLDDRPRAGAWRIAALLTGILAVAWFWLAATHPTTTYHLAPLLVAAAWPITGRYRVAGPLPPRAAASAAFGGAVVAAATLALLLARHALLGPTLFGPAGAPAEAAIAIALGAAAGGWLAARGRRRRLDVSHRPE